MKRHLRWVALPLAVGAIGGGYYYWAHGASAPITITTAAVARGDVVETVDATGTLQAVTTVQVGTQVSGTIKGLYADFNSRVRRGQVVARLEPSLFEAQVAQARASLARLQADAQRSALQLEDAQQKLKRARELAARQLIPATDLEAAEMAAREAASAVKSAEAQIAQARASLNQNEVNLAHTVIAAPIDGIVISRNVDVGQTVAASMQAPTLFVIARDLKQMQVNASVSESDIGRIRTGEAVTFRVDAYPTDVFSGIVSQVRLQPVVEQNVVSYLTVIDVPNTDMRLKPGMTANVTIETARASDVLLVPSASLRVRPSADVLAALGQAPPDPSPTPTGGSSRAGETAGPTDKANHTAPAAGQLWVQIEGRLSPVPVRVGITDGKYTAVFSDALAEGARVVSSIATDAAPAAAGTSPLLPAFRGRGGGGAGTRATGARPPGA